MQRHGLTDDANNPHNPNTIRAAPSQPDGDLAPSSAVIRTPDQRARIFVSSTLDELGPERAAVRDAITKLRLIPVMFESGARAHPPRDLYRAYLDQSAIFVGIYWQRYGWVAPGMTISGLEDEYALAQGKPKLIYIKAPAPMREPRLQTLLDRVREEEVTCYRRFSTAEELQELLQDDLAVLLTERFEQTRLRFETGVSAAETRDLPAGTVTFLFTDIEDSTRLLQQLGEERYAAAHAEHHQFVRAAFIDHGGREVNSQGDSFFFAFPTATGAITAVATAQRAFAARSWPDGSSVRMRMGLHTGTPRLTEGGTEYVGLDVVRAALIAAAGYGGQALLSEATKMLVEEALPPGTTLRDLGPHQLKDLQRPEHVYQIVLEDLPADFPPLKTLDRYVHNLPIQPTPLIGREQEVANLCALLRRDHAQLLTLTGPGGVGKTRLGLQVAAEVVEAFADGVWFVSLSRLADPALVIPTIAQTVGVQEAGSIPLVQLLRAHLQSKQTLLVLDNCEQVTGAAPQVAELLASCPSLQVLATSRIALHLQGEREVSVGPLALAPTSQPPGRQVPTGRLLEAPAVALFVARAQAHRPDFQLTEANASIVAEICARLDGLPLAIDLAAAHIKLLPPQQLLARLERRLPLLIGGTRDLEARQQTMRNTLAWSEDLLSSEERRLFRRLAVFMGGFTLDAAEAVCAQPAEVEPLGIDILEGLGALVDHSLVQPWTVDRDEDAGVEARFRWLYVVREYAMERLEASDEAAALRAAHAAHYLALVERVEPELRGAGQQAAEWLQRVEREYDNVRAALGWLRDRREVTGGLRLAVGVGDYWIANSRFSEGRNLLEALLAMAPQGVADSAEANVPAVVQAQARALLGTLEALLGNDDAAAIQLEAGLALGRALGDRRAIVYTLGSLGDLARVRGEVEQAAARYEEMAMIAREVGGPAGAIQALGGEGLAAYERGEWVRAAALLEEELTIHRTRHEQDAMGLCLWLLGVVSLRQKDPTRATVRLQEAVTLAQALGNQDGLAYVLESLAWASAANGQGERAARLLGAAAARRKALGQIRWPHFRKEVEAEVAPVREALGEQRWTAANAAGEALSLEEAIAEALEEMAGAV